MSDKARLHHIWARSLTWVALVAMVLAAGLYVLKSLRDLPGDAVDSGRAVLKDVQRVVEAFQTGTVTTSFVSYATEVSGSTRLQFATLKQIELFERRDEAATLWGNLELPEVVVRATAPVEYTYTFDLEGRWDFLREGARIVAVPPEITFNTPAVDASAIEYEVRAGSLFRDEATALARLKAGITEMSRRRARENIPLVRELGRRRSEEFIRTWLARGFSDGEDFQVDVVFRDELEDGEVQVPRGSRDVVGGSGT